MAKIIIENNKNEAIISDGSYVKETCEKLGIIFGCKQGICGTCRVQVLEGINNLSEKNEKEKNMDLSENERLMCQSKIKNGIIKIKQEW